MVNSLRIWCVVDNKSDSPEFKKEHGLSFWIKADDHEFLFDTGQGKALLPNIKALGLDADKLEAVVVSHGHYDHTGGLGNLLNLRPGMKVFAHPGFDKTRFGRAELKFPVRLGLGFSRSIGMTESSKEVCSNKGELVLTRQSQEIFPGVFVTGGIPRNIAFENQDRRFFLDHGGKEEDLIDDDQSLWIETSQGIVVFAGCAHAGLINILDQISNLSGESKIYSIFGGFHLAKANKEYLSKIKETIRRYKIQFLGPCHCTGDRAMDYLREVFPASFIDVKCGWDYSI